MDSVLQLNTSTGEILGKKYKVDKLLTKYIGIDMPHLSDCKTKDQIIDYTSQIDRHVKYPVEINYPLLVEYTNNLTPKEFALLNHLCKGVFAWSFYDGCTKKMAIQLKNTKVVRDLNTLIDMKLVKCINKGGVSKTDILLKVNPTLCFKGGRGVRGVQINRWYGC